MVTIEYIGLPINWKHDIQKDENMGISQSRSMKYAGEVPRNFLAHLFLVDNRFMISKFITGYLKYSAIEDFNYEKFVGIQLQLLHHRETFSSTNVLDLRDASLEEVLAVIVFWEILQNYTKLLGKSDFYDSFLRINGNEKIVDQYFEFKRNLLSSLDFLSARENLSWKGESVLVVKTIGIWLQPRLEQKYEVEIDDRNYYPERGIVRFFLYSFFWFEMFSEERQDSVNLGKIFNAQDYEQSDFLANEGREYEFSQEEWWQYNVIASILKKKNTLGLLSTGSGKSITFLLSGMLQPGTCFIVAPLKSLIDDQFFNLEKNFFLNWLTGRLHSGLDVWEQRDSALFLTMGKYKFFYCAPERLQIKKFVELINEVGVSRSIQGQDKIKYLESYITNPLSEDERSALGTSEFSINEIVIDEAHCLSERGHDFRFSYLNIGRFTEYLKKQTRKIPLIALTATASDIVKKDIIKYLEIEHVVEESTLNRPNLSMQVVFVEDIQEKNAFLRQLLDEDLDKTLSHIANLNNKKIMSISYASEGDMHNEYENGGIIFTIYGPIWSKTAEESILQSAEYLERILSEGYSDKNYVQKYFSESPDASYDVCPECESIDLVKLEPKRTGGMPKLYFDPIDERYLTYWALPSDLNARWRCKEVDLPSQKVWICNNSACGWKSYESSHTVPISLPIEKGITEKEIKMWREKKKNEIQEQFKTNEIGLLIATKGFGMGIDKKNVRYIIHSTLSWSLEAYYQEIGRAGRDKEHSHCVLLFSPPVPECLEITHDFSAGKIPPCMQDPECMQYLKCPLKPWMKLCDVARQWRMMSNPIILDGTFLHNQIDNENFFKDLSGYEFGLQADKKKQSYCLKHELMRKIEPWFSHMLSEFFQLYFFYQDCVKSAQENNGVCVISTQGILFSWQDSSGIEKLIYRLVSLGLYTHYFKEYKLSYVNFYAYVSTEDYHQKLYHYLTEKLGIVPENIDDALKSGVESYPHFADWIIQQEPLVQDFWKLIYHVYQKVEVQRHEMLKNLYRVIRDSQAGCFRQKILGRLSGLMKTDTTTHEIEKCWFCSGCHTSMMDITVSSWLLSWDRQIREVNALIKKRLKGGILTEKEQSIIDTYNLQEDEVALIKTVFKQVEWGGIDAIVQLQELLKKSPYDITPMIQRKLETGIQNPWYWLLSAYYIPEDRETNLMSIWDYYRQDLQSLDSDFLSLLDWIVEDWGDNIKKELYTWILEKKQDELSFVKCYLIQKRFGLSDEKAALLLALPGVLKIMKKRK